ncbi:Acetyl-CoA_carboxylase/pyruvate carboxylase fusion protein [Hexamita inflata]|uniref:Acetyl-coenzyme A carboxylase carboxyl transferase subunits beta/alpha n=1 Tax=Hexamita inflata TaxID=28002 RepID=A0AA86P312_9EUKA|nr:Acetyl-CoA carboxylase/pyruvate carboxylase fusion protein [Hexamita inflata]
MELFENISSLDFLHFSFKSINYQTQLAEAQVKTKQLCGCSAHLKSFGAHKVVYVKFNFQFMGGSLGCAEGEKIHRCVDYCIQHKLPLIIDAQSGGVRMQEGVLALMQMSSTVTSLDQFKKHQMPSISIFRDPCFGGTSASFMYQTDIQIGIKGARMGFAGPQVIQNTIFDGDQNKFDSSVPAGFQTIDRQAEQGFCDLVVTEEELDSKLELLLSILANKFIPSSHDIDSQKLLQKEEFSYKECRGPLHTSPSTYVDQLVLKKLDFQSDGAIQVSLGNIESGNALIINSVHNSSSALSGLGTPIGYRQVAKFVRLASRLNITIISIVDTAGALPSPEAEDKSQAQAISDCLAAFSQSKALIISIITGEGGSGGALALAGGNVVACLQKSFYNVISPEGGVSILQHSAYSASEKDKMKSDFSVNCEILANAQKCYSYDIHQLGIVDALIPTDNVYSELKKFIIHQQNVYSQFSGEELVQKRQARFRNLSKFAEIQDIKAEFVSAMNHISVPSQKAKKVQPAIDSETTKLVQFIAEKTINNTKKLSTKEIIIPQFTQQVEPQYPTPKQVLLSKGPKAVQEFIKNSKHVYITDTSFRDAHQSLAATRHRKLELVTAAHVLEKSGMPYQNLFSAECWGGATFDTALRFLQEDPWARLKKMSSAIPNTLTQMLLRGANAVGYTRYPDNVIKNFIIEAAKNGMDVFRVFDAFNDLDQMALCVDTVLNETQKLVEVCICFTGELMSENETVYTLNYYKNLASNIYKRWPNAHFICIKDMAGLVTPQMAEPLITAIQEATENQIPIHFHTHDTSGGQIATCMAMARAGVKIIDCASASMSGLTSQPCMQTFLKFMDQLSPELEKNLQTYDSYWLQVRQLYAQTFETDISTVRAPCADIYTSQIPGGQISNLHQQCIQMGLGDRFDELKRMYATVNQLFGNVIKVTPSSKVVGDLALFMLQNNYTYEQVTDQIQMRGVNFPESTRDFLQGGIGVPHVGFNQKLVKAVFQLTDEELNNRKLSQAVAQPIDLQQLQIQVQKQRPYGNSVLDSLSAALYPKVFSDFVALEAKNSRLVPQLPAAVFMNGMTIGQSIKINTNQTLKLMRIKNPEINGDRPLVFELDGQMMNIVVKRKIEVKKEIKMATSNPGDHASLVLGVIETTAAQKNEIVKKGQLLLKISSAKLEVKVTAKKDGIVKDILKEGDKVVPGALVAQIE